MQQTKSGLYIRTLGSPGVSWAGEPVFQGKKKATALLVYLALQPEQRALRSKLAELLWEGSEEGRARSSLRQCLSEIRREAPDLMATALEVNTTDIALRADFVSSDIGDLIAALAQKIPGQHLEAGAEFSDLFLMGFGHIGQGFENWARECCQSCETQLIARLFDLMEAPQTRAAEALRAARIICRLDPLNEEASRFAMRSLAERGETGASLQIYGQLYDRLDEALAMEPSAETQALAVAIKNGDLQHAKPKPPRTQPRGVSSAASSIAPNREGPPKLAIFPFVDLGPVPVESYFLHGILEDTVSLLAQLRELQVYSSNTTRQFQGLPGAPGSQPPELDADYVVTGSVRGAGDRFRITVQLVDTRTGLVEWANTYAAHASELFEMQTDIAINLTHQLLPSVSAAELRRTEGSLPEDLSAYHLMIRGRDIAFHLDPATFTTAKSLLEEACARDPRYGISRVALTDWHSVLLGQGWSKDPATDGKALQNATEEAVRLSGESGRALARYAHNQTVLFGYAEQAIEICGKALRNAPNDAEALLWSSPTLTFSGQPEQGINNARTAIHLSPCDPYLFRSEHFLSIAHFAAGNYAEAVAAGRRAQRLNPNYTSNLRMTAVALAETGDLAEAGKIASEIKRLDPGFRIGQFLKKQPFQDQATGQRYAARLREIGLQD
ncbi:BTAD domain-containing putative transcriptional regulator [Pseudophaeobacter sp. TrK17]|uniref:BTAD domain-containing putative transcriptional regulator n=1 Tax=Pseudophaeobacter sp. TrK17 TaxID=2815167 RepID=UPI0035CEC89A